MLRRPKVVTAGLVVLCAAALLALSGCGYSGGERPPSGAREPVAVAARVAAAATQEAHLRHAAAAEPISTSVDDNCEPGRFSAPWGPFDSYYWSCRRTTSWVVTSVFVDPGELIAAVRAHLATTECQPDVSSFDQVQQYWAMYGVRGHLDSGEAYTVNNLPSAVAQCPDGARIGIAFSSAAAFDASKYLNLNASEGEIIEAKPHDQTAVHTSDSELILVMSTDINYYSVPRSKPELEPTRDPNWCACYSGSECDCPGG